jgi:hypothetical protein
MPCALKIEALRASWRLSRPPLVNHVHLLATDINLQRHRPGQPALGQAGVHLFLSGGFSMKAPEK